MNKTIYWHWTGPLMKVENDLLTIENLNPEVKTKWRMSRLEMLRTAWWLMIAAIFQKSPS
jgi:hypothetical protein